MSDRTRLQTTIDVLIIESDDDYAAELLARMQHQAESQGVQFRSWRATSLAQLDRGIIPGDVDLVLTSLELVDGSGLRTYDEVQARYPSTPVIVIADGDGEDAMSAVSFGAVAGISKGAEDEAPLLSTIRQAIIRHQASLDIQEWQIRHEEQHRLATIGQLVGGLAPEFNNANSIIIGFADRLLQQELDEDQLRDLQRIKSAAKHSADVTRHLQALTKSNNTARNRVSLSDAIHRAMLLVRNQLESEGVHLGIVLYQKPLYVEGDINALAQAIMHVLINAQHAMRRSLQKMLEVDLSPSRDGQTAIITIRDTGCGMNDQVISRIFEPFFSTKGVHAKNAEDAEIQGIGLGMAITDVVVSSLQGTIDISSAPDMGTTITIALPLLRPGQELTPQQGAPITQADALMGKTFLVVHPDPDLRELLAGALESAGAQILPALDASKAFCALDQFKIHGLIVDQKMHTMTLASFLASVREKLGTLPPTVVCGPEGGHDTDLLPTLGTVELLEGSWDGKAVQDAMRRALAAADD